jgi:DNA-directed RNA polymerase alpha subunit
MTLRNFGVKSLQELADRLGELGLPLIQAGNSILDAEGSEEDSEAEAEAD